MLQEVKTNEKGYSSANAVAEEKQEYFSGYLKISSPKEVKNYYEGGIAKAVSVGVRNKCVGMRISLLYDMTITFDDVVYTKEQLTYELRGVQYTYEELGSMWTTYWQYGERLYVIVPVKYGIRHGRHTVTVKMTYPGPTDVLATLEESFEVTNTGDSY